MFLVLRFRDSTHFNTSFDARQSLFILNARFETISRLFPQLAVVICVIIIDGLLFENCVSGNFWPLSWYLLIVMTCDDISVSWVNMMWIWYEYDMNMCQISVFSSHFFSHFFLSFHIFQRYGKARGRHPRWHSSAIQRSVASKRLWEAEVT